MRLRLTSAWLDVDSARRSLRHAPGRDSCARRRGPVVHLCAAGHGGWHVCWCVFGSHCDSIWHNEASSMNLDLWPRRLAYSCGGGSRIRAVVPPAMNLMNIKMMDSELETRRGLFFLYHLLIFIQVDSWQLGKKWKFSKCHINIMSLQWFMPSRFVGI